MLKNSARNCRLSRSLSRNFLAKETSVVASPGPCSTLRPAFPYVPGVGWMNASGLKYSVGPPRITGPLKLGFKDGLTGLRVSPSFDGLYESCGVNGSPD